MQKLVERKPTSVSLLRVNFFRFIEKEWLLCDQVVQDVVEKILL